MAGVVAIAVTTCGEIAPAGPVVPAIMIRQLSKSFDSTSGTILVLEGVNLDIEEGGFVSVLGPSGCGKSTLLRIVAGLVGYESGIVMVRGQPVGQPRAEVGVVFQTPNLLAWRTVIGNLRTRPRN